jgi:hypothetical protein
MQSRHEPLRAETMGAMTRMDDERGWLGPVRNQVWVAARFGHR